MELEPFQRINPCGYAGLQMTQLAELGQPNASVEQTGRAFAPTCCALSRCCVRNADRRGDAMPRKGGCLNPRLMAPLCLLAFHAPLPAEEASPSDMVVIDLRPKEEKEGFALAELSGKCNKDVFRIPDVATDPLKVEILKADLAQMLTVDTGGKTLTVLNWSVYYNKQTQGGGGMLDSVGIQGYSVPGKKKEKHPGSKCSRKESAGGWYEGKEATTLYFPSSRSSKGPSPASR
jgi:hypothetical protein